MVSWGRLRIILRALHKYISAKVSLTTRSIIVPINLEKLTIQILKVPQHENFGLVIFKSYVDRWLKDRKKYNFFKVEATLFYEMHYY
jgi:hypothetical protein